MATITLRCGRRRIRGYDPANPFRNSNAYYFLPSEDEWYKGGYYDPDANGGAGGYWDYATGSNIAPVTTSGRTAPSTAVCRDFVNPNPVGPAGVNNAGGLSACGTMAQNGNVWEWGGVGGSGFDPPNDSAGELRVFRGGYWLGFSFLLSSSNRIQPHARVREHPPSVFASHRFLSLRVVC